MIKRIYREAYLKEIPAKWQEQYCRLGEPRWNVVAEKLLALHWPFSREAVDEIIGNTSWTSLCCSECDKDCESLVRIGASEPDYDNHCEDLCADCVGKVGAA